jgi:hypothetical protein
LIVTPRDSLPRPGKQGPNIYVPDYYPNHREPLKSKDFPISTYADMYLQKISTYFKETFFSKRLPGVGSKPGASGFHLFSHFSPLYC